MPKFVSLLIDKSHQRYLGFGLWVATFTVLLLVVAVLWGQLITQTMSVEAKALLEPHERLRQNVSSTLAEMKVRLTAEPCSPAFHDQLREIAYLPDGLNEFLYAPAGIANCSVNADFAPHNLGTPDVRDDAEDVSIYYDHPLDFIRPTGLVGTIVLFGDIGIVVPRQASLSSSTDWVHFELVDRSSDGKYWYDGGQAGIYDQALQDGPWGRYLPLQNGAFFAVDCLADGRTCVATTAPLSEVFGANGDLILLSIVLSAIVALAISGQLHALLRRFWSFDARFLRNFKQQNIICTYQPIVSLAAGKITGCEVLVRWRDLDGAMIYPDQFLPLVEKHGLGKRLTEYVVACAYAELSGKVPEPYRLQVNFNVFPSDLDAVWLRDTLRPFDVPEGRFDPVVEIIETESMQIEHAQSQIDALHRFGIKTHLDDFGTGYSNIENLARLPVAGIKLDRSFAMAPDGSLMSKMLGNAIEMIHAAGHKITVEGVETEQCLAMLKSTGQVDFVQGYLISRPLDITRFVNMLVEQSMPQRLRPTLVA